MKRRFARAVPVTLLSALLALVSAASAETRLRRAAPPEAAGPCARFGPDYRAVGGSDTCLRFSGSVRAEMGLTTGGGREVGSFLSNAARKP